MQPIAAAAPRILTDICARPARASYDEGMTTLVGCVWDFLRDHSLLITYCDDASTSEQWIEYVKALRILKGRDAKLLIYAAAVPPREVLADIASVARGEHWTVSLISPSVAVRFAASTFSLVVRGFRFFTPDSLSAALGHLGCDDALTRRALGMLATMRGREGSLSPQR